MERKDIKKQVTKRFIESCDSIIKSKGYKSDADFCKALGLHPANFSDMRAGKLQAGTDLISILLSLYPEIDARWLLLGEGEGAIDVPPYTALEEIPPNEHLQEMVQKEVQKKFEELKKALLEGLAGAH